MLQNATVYTRTLHGLTPLKVSVEVHIYPGTPQLNLVGLPETAIRESAHRVKSAIINSQFQFPVRRITVNLAPANLPKEGSHFDLAIALAILTASKQLPNHHSHYSCFGELGLNGELKAVNSLLPLLQHNDAPCFIPETQANQLNLIQEGCFYPVQSLNQVCELLSNTQLNPPAVIGRSHTTETGTQHELADVKGQLEAKRALEIAASGGHHLIFCGPPGAGKTMLANRFTDLLPALSPQQALDTACIYHLNQYTQKTHWFRPLFRAPHHSASAVALIGGGRPIRPGEISLAHNGVLFLDELPEFRRDVLEALREPLESGEITIARATGTYRFPAHFQLIASMNPCPCGYLDHPEKNCCCRPDQVARYQQRISGPILDRIDLKVQLKPQPASTIFSETTPAETSACVKKRVARAQAIQLNRANKLNAALSEREVIEHANLSRDDFNSMESILNQFKLSTRSHIRWLRVARTIADLSDGNKVTQPVLLEALNFVRGFH